MNKTLMMKRRLLLIVFLSLVTIAGAQELSYTTEIDISYYSEDIRSDNQYIS
ncbi:MAG: hypothetical protein IH594_11065, partial [Bacteroidales bacterium]|nr:hypothetical protein [Bacteroidales bacterium]